MRWWITFFTDRQFNHQAKVDMHDKLDKTYQWLLTQIKNNKGKIYKYGKYLDLCLLIFSEAKSITFHNDKLQRNFQEVFHVSEMEISLKDKSGMAKVEKILQFHNGLGVPVVKLKVSAPSDSVLKKVAKFLKSLNFEVA